MDFYVLIHDEMLLIAVTSLFYELRCWKDLRILIVVWTFCYTDSSIRSRAKQSSHIEQAHSCVLEHEYSASIFEHSRVLDKVAPEEKINSVVIWLQ